MKKSSIDSQEEARARLKEKMENKRRKQSKSLSKNPKDNDENRVGQSLLRWSAD